MNTPKISIIIPTFNEEKFIFRLLEFLKQQPVHEILVCDGGSTDNTSSIVKQFSFAQWIACPHKGRAVQMNQGASRSTGEILYFIHADVRLSETFVEDIKTAIQQGYDYGCYRYRFDSPSLLLKINAFFTQFNSIFFRGGDQTLFIKRTVFDAVCGFRKEFRIMEDYDILVRLQKQNYRFVILPKSILISARKFEQYGYWRVQKAYYIVMLKWRLGASNAHLYETYKQLLN